MKNSGYMLVGVLMATVIGSITMLTFSHWVTFNLRLISTQKASLQIKIDLANATITELQSETSSVPKICEAGETCSWECGTPIACLHTTANGKNYQACEDDCVKTGNTWFKGTQECSIGIQCIN